MKKSNISNCEQCGKEFVKKHKNHKYCSSKCKEIYRRNFIKNVEHKCSNCGKKYNSSHKKRYENNFCSLDCELEFKKRESHKVFKCPICGKEMTIPKSDNRMFCSMKCQGEWQSENRIGENASNYDNTISIKQRTKVCKFCKKEYIVNKYKIDKSIFCSMECSREWYATVFSQSKEWREESRIRAVKILEDGLISKTNTNPQIIVNNILKNMAVDFINEKGFKYFTIDNFIKEKGLLIEVMGTYWHCDHRKYPEIKYNRQKDRIKRDKAKHTYIKNKTNIEILYLWEEDIMNNEDLCSMLVSEYIKKDGVLENYHSFNYKINEGTLNIKQNTEKPYMEYDSKDILGKCNIIK